MNSHIYFLQDIHCNKEQESIFKKDWEGKMYIAPGTSNSRGTAILFRNNFEFSVNDSKIDQQGNYIALKVNMVNTEVTLISLYGPNADNPGFYNIIAQVIDDFETPTIILGGDWNLVQNQEYDTKFYIRNNNIQARQRVISLKEQFDLKDPWRINLSLTS